MKNKKDENRLINSKAIQWSNLEIWQRSIRQGDDSCGHTGQLNSILEGTGKYESVVAIVRYNTMQRCTVLLLCIPAEKSEYRTFLKPLGLVRHREHGRGPGQFYPHGVLCGPVTHTRSCGHSLVSTDDELRRQEVVQAIVYVQRIWITSMQRVRICGSRRLRESVYVGGVWWAAKEDIMLRHQWHEIILEWILTVTKHAQHSYHKDAYIWVIKFHFIPAPLFCLTKGNRGAARATGLSMDLRFFCGPIRV